MKEQDKSTEIIALKNIGLLVSAIHDAMNASVNMPKIVTFSGPSGYGKSFAAAYAANKFDCGYIEVGGSWSLGFLVENILKELGTVTTAKTIAAKTEAAIEALIVANKPLIIDEFDFCIKPRFLETIREFHDKAGVPIIVIGEELLPKKLELTERFHNRVLRWVKAEPVSLEDAKNLAKLYAPKLNIKEDVLKKLVKLSQGRVRRVCVNLEQIKNAAKLNNWKEVSLSMIDEEILYTGNAPAPRRI